MLTSLVASLQLSTNSVNFFAMLLVLCFLHRSQEMFGDEAAIGGLQFVTLMMDHPSSRYCRYSAVSEIFSER